MTTCSFRLTPIDTLLFRDSRPFDAELLQAEVETLFPPPGRTLIGAVRLALARGQGFEGPRRWGGELAAVLGDGPADLGRLRFGGPWLARREGGRVEPLYPMPLHQLGTRARGEKGKGEGEGDPREGAFVPRTCLGPGREVLCDLGRVRLPEPLAPLDPKEPLGGGAGLFLRPQGLEAVLAGELPAASEVVAAEALYAPEQRVGLERDAARRTAQQGKLYRATHLRLREGVCLVLEAEGVPEGWARACPRLIALGGEGRMAELEAGEVFPPIAAPLEAIQRSRRLTVTLLTPLRLERETMPRAGEMLGGLEGARVIAACLGKPVRLGGWDSLQREPLPLRPYLPAGSTWFCEIEPGREGAVCARHGSGLGPETALGLGRIALGTWNESAKK